MFDSKGKTMKSFFINLPAVHSTMSRTMKTLLDCTTICLALTRTLLHVLTVL